MQDQTPYLRLQNIQKTFGKSVVLEDVSLNVYAGEFVFLLGPSGCGKTTLLRIIAGLEAATRGTVVQDGRDVTYLPASRRDFGIVFQSYALFPNLTVTENLAYGLQSLKLSKGQIAARVQELLSLIGLSGFEKRYPAQLSGGQQQRVALARALAMSPSLLLLDEPLSALDARVRAHLRVELSALQRRLGVTTIMVTHDQEEALTMADRIVVMDHGHIVQVGAPFEIYQSPATPFVADFVGHMNFLPGVVTSDAYAPVHCAGAAIQIQPWHNGLAPGSKVTLAIRPEEIRIVETGTAGPNLMVMELRALEYTGPSYRLHLHTEDPISGQPVKLVAYLPREQLNGTAYDAGRQVVLQLPAQALHLFAHDQTPTN